MIFFDPSAVTPQALDKAKEAGRKERMLCKQREQASLTDQLNLDLTYCVSHTHTLTHSHTHILTHFHTLTFTHSHTHTLTLTHTHSPAELPMQLSWLRVESKYYAR